MNMLDFFRLPRKIVLFKNTENEKSFTDSEFSCIITKTCNDLNIPITKLEIGPDVHFGNFENYSEFCILSVKCNRAQFSKLIEQFWTQLHSKLLILNFYQKVINFLIRSQHN